jgi:hypothetical protein
MQKLDIEKTGEMLNEEQYWSLAENSLKMTKNQGQQAQFLITEIKKLYVNEIIGFTLRTHHLLNETYTLQNMVCGSYPKKILKLKSVRSISAVKN